MVFFLIVISLLMAVYLRRHGLSTGQKKAGRIARLFRLTNDLSGDIQRWNNLRLRVFFCLFKAFHLVKVQVAINIS